MALAAAEARPVPIVRNSSSGTVALNGVRAYEQIDDRTTNAVSLGLESATYGSICFDNDFDDVLGSVDVDDDAGSVGLALAFTSNGICDVFKVDVEVFDDSVTSEVQLRAFVILSLNVGGVRFEMNSIGEGSNDVVC